MNDLVEFIKVADVGLAQEVAEGDYDGLVAVMGHLMAVKDRQATTDEMFEPLKQTIELLKTYGQELPEEVHMQLQVNLVSFVVWLSMTWCGMSCSAVWCNGPVWSGLARPLVLCCVVLWYGMAWRGVVWCGVWVVVCGVVVRLVMANATG